MTDIATEEVHRRTRRMVLPSSTLMRLAAQHVCELCGDVSLEWGEVSYKVRFEDETEGSPSYTVGQKAIVEIIEDLTIKEAPR